MSLYVYVIVSQDGIPIDVLDFLELIEFREALTRHRLLQLFNLNGSLHADSL